MKYLLLYLSAAIIFFAIDMLWLGWLARDFYREKLDFLLSDQTNWVAAFLFYLIYLGGILYFAVLPGLRAGEWQSALLNGALLGLLCYATYDLTNTATVKNWPWMVTIVDLVWGTVLTGAVSLATFFIGKNWLGF